MSFRKSKIILREGVGAYTNGIYVAGVKSFVMSAMSVQPMTGKDLQPLPVGRHMADYIKMYGVDRLNVAADGENVQPDIVVHEGYGYELIAIEPNRSDVINHYKYMGVKVFKFTSTADWLSGALKRP